MTNFNEQLKKLSEPLTISQIDFRVQSINRGGYATILAYKDARVDMDRLDEVLGPNNWKREHKLENRNCIVSIYDPDKKEWVGKEDTGSESNQDAEKGLASDSFKRACFNLGIGRELYNYPAISVKLNDNEWEKPADGSKDKPKPTWNFKLKEWKWYAEFEGRKITFLAAQDDAGKTRFTWGTRKPKTNSEKNV